MPVLNRVADLLPDIVAYRRDIHAHPELGFDEHRTSAFVAERLREFGCDEVVTGIGRTGVVGVIKGKRAMSNGNLKVIGLRADMDALPIEEGTGLPYASKSKGLMHACGHDGHTAMLLGAARYLAETRNFAGTAVLIFEPAEEVGTGAQAMLDDGLMERFGIDQVFGMHNAPGLPIGVFGIRQGPVRAATDSIEIRIEGLGGHPGRPHKCIDSILVGAQLVTALQQVLAQNVDPLESAGLSFHEFHSGTTQRVVPQTAELRGSMRTLKPEVRQLVKKRIGEVVAGIAQVTGAKIDLTIESSDAVVFNHAAPTELAIRAAKDVAGEDNVHETPPVLGGEDFSFMAEARPGAYVIFGNGDSAQLHHAAYDFNDEAIPYGTSFWIKLVENTLKA
ncbi:MAG: amidohydrolase [Mesorhizobium sp.]|uniref:M20 aminoacylase family protein n=2 Tax=Mesorhizobium TaxID=68287 RepID=UPI000FE5774D|nr:MULTISPECIES: M20 aminoacylase family protein [unclassified Mesorhizobium]MDF3249594.1 M20 family metallopeptidase [Mesorhizobium sp. XAP4]RWN24710.1 MAG: amidohydrolase [Mesorhizobium sp.]RWN40266.1 MAG: amidohydrolase [Mesorhizobium sp.]TJV13095.1 MAG: amidohydrolase [Mesorhizobium sp.]TJV20455.1 MAG: amidohydrolase [Mesorhizobium sp.]